MEDEQARAQRSIAAFIDAASDLPGPPVGELVEAVLAVVRSGHRDTGGLLDGVPHNKVVAVQLDLSRRSLDGDPTAPERWVASAASSLLSGFVIEGSS